MHCIKLRSFLIPIFSLAVLIGTMLASNLALAALSRQPYLQSVSDTRVILRWRTTSATSSRVSYGPSVGNLNVDVDVNGTRTEHEVVITGLTPNTKYFYSVGATTGTIEAGNDADHYFMTAPVVGSNRKIRIWAIGDPGTGDSNQADVRNAYFNLDTIQTDVVLTLGDNAYEDGTDSEYTSNFFNVYSDLFRHTPVWAARGNHERNLGAHEDAFSHPTQGEAGGIASGTELYYSFDYGNIHFVCLDSFTSTNLNGDAMYTWLENDLASTTQEWIIAFWHHPPYSRSSSHDSDSEVGQRVTRERANPILEAYGVDLQLGGHNHFYSRTYLINDHYGLSGEYNTATHAVDGGDGRTNGDGEYQKGENPEGAVYVLAGSSGKQGYTPLNHPANYTVIEQLASMVIDVEGDRMDVRMLQSNSSIPDYFTITKSPAANQPPVVNAGPDQTITLPSSVALDGSVSDDGLPSGVGVTSTWSLVSGPGNVSFGDSSSATTVAGFSVGGTYVLRLSASDSEFDVNDEMTVVVIPAPTNVPPTVSAGADQETFVDIEVFLIGSVTDDGLPTGAQLTSTWSQVSGPGVAIFGDTSVAATTAIFDTAGIYILRLSATDSEFNTSDDTTITVIPMPPVNQAPVVNAGADQSIELPNAATLNGVVSDDGLPSATVTASWTKASGPGVVTFADAASASTSASFSTIGTYVLELTASDGELSDSDSVTITVNDAPDTDPPTAPRNLIVSALTDVSVLLTWDAASDNVAVAEYRVSRDGMTVSLSNSLSFDDNGLSPATTYAYSVIAIDAAGNESSAATVSATTAVAADTQAPTKVTNFVASAVTTNSVTLTWDAATDNVAVTAYRVSRNGAVVSTGSVLSYVDTNLAASTTYSYDIVALDAAGNESASTNVSATTQAGGSGSGGGSGGGAAGLFELLFLASLLVFTGRSKSTVHHQTK